MYLTQSIYIQLCDKSIQNACKPTMTNSNTIRMYSRRYGVQAGSFHFAHAIPPIRSGHAEIMQRSRNVPERFAVFDEFIFFVVDVEPSAVAELKKIEKSKINEQFGSVPCIGRVYETHRALVTKQ